MERSYRLANAAMHNCMERRGPVARYRAERLTGATGESLFRLGERRRSEISLVAALMLHLLSCYVSKAAIFRARRSRAGRKSKSRFNSKGLGSARRRILATVFPLRVRQQ
jgi:hypothetical protein